MALTELQVKNAKPKEKPYKLYDGGGLYMIVTPKGSKWWRFDYTFQGKRKTISLGVYPDVSLKEAREKRIEIKKLLSEKIDPSEKQIVLFKKVAEEWFAKKEKTWTPNHARTVLYRINSYILPSLGERPVNEITAPEVYKILQKIESQEKIETAHRVKQIISMIFRYGIVMGICDRDPASDLGRGVLITKKPKHYPTILEPERIGALLRAIDGYEYLIVRCALKLLLYTFLRPGELRKARWSEINFNDSLWEIPAERMKMKRPHIVPLSKQALNILTNLHKATGDGEYLFPSSRGHDRYISNMTMNAALRRMGYNTKEEITSHGVRAMARTLLHEKLGFSPEVIEHQLAHTVPDLLGEAYNRTKFIEERIRMMQAWADYLDSLKAITSV